MRKFSISLFLFLCIITWSLNSYSALVIKADSLAVSVENRTGTDATARYAPPYQDYHRGGNRAVSALCWAIAGILFAPLGIIAFVKGIQALNRKERNKGIAIIAVVLGALEILLCIAAIAFTILLAGGF